MLWVFNKRHTQGKLTLNGPGDVKKPQGNLGNPEAVDETKRISHHPGWTPTLPTPPTPNTPCFVFFLVKTCFSQVNLLL